MPNVLGVQVPAPGKRSVGTAKKPNKKLMPPKGGGHFRSEAQRAYLWVAFPTAARKRAHHKVTSKRDYRRHSKWYDPAKDPNVRAPTRRRTAKR